MTEDLRVRPVEPSDFDAWLPLWEGYNAFYGREGETALPAVVTQSTWKRFFDEAEPVQGLVAVADGRLVGLAHYLFHRNTIRIEPTCYLQDLYADSDFRGGGVGRALVETFFDKAREAGCRDVYWHTHISNQTAMRLYDKVAENTEFVVYRKSV